MKTKEKILLSDKKQFSAKESVNIVFDKLGGIDAMSDWASRYPTEFYKMYIKVLEAELKKEQASKDEIVIEGKAKDL
jgi:dihydroorotase